MCEFGVQNRGGFGIGIGEVVECRVGMRLAQGRLFSDCPELL